MSECRDRGESGDRHDDWRWLQPDDQVEMATRKLGLSAIPLLIENSANYFRIAMGGTSSPTQSAAVLPVVISLSLVLRAGKVTSRGLLRSPSQVISRLAQAILPGNLLQTAARSTPLRRLQVPL